MISALHLDDQGALIKLHFRHRHIFLLEGVLERIISSSTTLGLLLKAVSPISPKGVLLDLIYTLAQCAHFATDASSVLTLHEPPRSPPYRPKGPKTACGRLGRSPLRSRRSVESPYPEASRTQCMGVRRPTIKPRVAEGWFRGKLTT